LKRDKRKQLDELRKSQAKLANRTSGAALRISSGRRAGRADRRASCVVVPWRVSVLSDNRSSAFASFFFANFALPSLLFFPMISSMRPPMSGPRHLPRKRGLSCRRSPTSYDSWTRRRSRRSCSANSAWHCARFLRPWAAEPSLRAFWIHHHPTPG
jgi:hypothetical protein